MRPEEMPKGTLAVAEGITQEGAVCTRCDYFSAGRFGRCPVCGGEAEALADVVDNAVERALLDGAQVEVVLGENRDWLLARGGMGALLRYRVPSP